MIHCSAGITRSATVGLTVESLLKSDFETKNSEIIKHERYKPNMLVYSTIIKKNNSEKILQKTSHNLILVNLCISPE